jgi:DNA polymerase
MGRAEVIVVGESPGKNEEVSLRPFQGESGEILTDLLEWCGIPRSFAHITNTVLCRPNPHQTPKEWQKAIKCCAPRLENELAVANKVSDGSYVLVLGAKGLAALTGHGSISAWRGYPLPALKTNARVFPTFHPAHILRHPHLLPIIKTDFQRFFEWQRGELTDWKWPPIIIDEGPEMEAALERILETGEAGVDVETAGINPYTSELLCLGLASPDDAISVPWPISNPDIDYLCREILSQAKVSKVFQNGNFDKISLQENRIEYRCDDEFDTLIAHRIVAPALPHDLGFMASMELGCDRWKTQFRVMSDIKGGERFRKAKEDPAKFRDMRVYNAKDAAATVLLRAPLLGRMTVNDRS